jgi:uncharacterized protein (TIGR02596 family)
MGSALTFGERGSRAFSLLELLIVMTIIVIMASLMGPTLNSALRGTALTQATDKVLGVLSIAHQTAITKAQTVEVRLYSYVNPETPGDTGQGHAIQAFSVDDNGVYTPLMKAQILPNTVIMATNSTLSTLMGLANSTAPATYAIPKASNTYTCASFQYYRSGATSLVSSSQATTVWGITVVNMIDMMGTNASTLPVNYATVVIDPYNGSLKTYRPHL